VGPTFGVAWVSGTALVLSFRATVTHREIQEDLNAWQVTWANSAPVMHSIPKTAGELNIEGSEPYVHAGFYAVFLQFIDRVLDTIGLHQPEVVLLAGHSLGAAVATLMTVRLAELKGADERMATVRQIGGYVFGTPRVGNASFDKKLRSERGVSTFWRVANDADDIQQLPMRVMPNLRFPAHNPLFYEHAGPGHVYYSQWGTWRTNHFLPNYVAQMQSLQPTP